MVAIGSSSRLLAIGSVRVDGLGIFQADSSPRCLTISAASLMLRPVPHRIGSPWVLLSVSLAVGFLPRSTSAQGAALLDRAKEQERTSLYREGVSLAETGHWAQALKKFETVVAMRSAPAALVALATAQEKAGKLASAKQTFLKARADAQALGDTELAQKAEKARTALEDRIARIVVLLPAGTSGAEVAIDGSPATADLKGIEADPGEHHIVVKVAGQPPFQQRFALAAEQKKEIAVQFVSEGAPDRALGSVALSSDAVSSGPPVGSWILGGAGVAATVIGLVVRFNGQARYDEVSAQCPGEKCASQAEADEANAARDRMLSGSIVAGAGVGLLASAGLWWALSSPSSRSEGTKSSAMPMTVAPTHLHGGAGMILRGTF